VRAGPGEMATRAWSLLHRAADAMTRCEGEALRAAGLSPQQFALLAAVRSLPVPVTQKKIADRLDRRANSVTALLNRMERDGLVKRSSDLRDRRTVRITLTPRGEEALERGRKIASELPPVVMLDFSGKEVRELVRLLERVRANTRFLTGLKKKLGAVEALGLPPVLGSQG